MRPASRLSSLLFAIALVGSSLDGARAAELLVSAAVSLKEPFVEIGQEFEREHPDTKVVFNFGASGALASQIEQGAPADVFASASKAQLTRLFKKGLLNEDTAKCFARNTLVVVVPLKGLAITSLAQLAKVKRLAIGNPETVPAGQYAVKVLRRANIFDGLSNDHRLVYGENVRQVLTYVENSDVDAGIVYGTEAKTSKIVHVSLQLATDESDPILYPIAIVKDSKHLELCRSFVAFVIGKDRQPIFKKFGFLAP